MARFNVSQNKNFGVPKGTVRCNKCDGLFQVLNPSDIKIDMLGADVFARYLQCPLCGEKFLIDFQDNECLKLEKEIKEQNTRIEKQRRHVQSLFSSLKLPMSVDVKTKRLLEWDESRVIMDEQLKNVNELKKRLEKAKASLSSVYFQSFTTNDIKQQNGGH